MACRTRQGAIRCDQLFILALCLVFFAAVLDLPDGRGICVSAEPKKRIGGGFFSRKTKGKVFSKNPTGSVVGPGRGGLGSVGAGSLAAGGLAAGGLAKAGKRGGGFSKTLGKAALIGVGGYTAYQIGKMSGRFSAYSGGFGGGRPWGFNEWNSWREADGFLCRSTADCNWIDRQLSCEDYELNFTPSNLWFGGDAASIVGECSCPNGLYWDQNQLQCRPSGINGNLVASIGTAVLVILVVLFILFACCCVGIGIVIFRKFLR